MRIFLWFVAVLVTAFLIAQFSFIFMYAIWTHGECDWWILSFLIAGFFAFGFLCARIARGLLAKDKFPLTFRYGVTYEVLKAHRTSIDGGGYLVLVGEKPKKRLFSLRLSPRWRFFKELPPYEFVVRYDMRANGEKYFAPVE